MHDDMDALLQQDLLQAPGDFAYRVAQGIKPLPSPFAVAAAAPAMPAPGWRYWVARIGLVGAGVLGLSQVLGFVFGVWLAGAAL